MTPKQQLISYLLDFGFTEEQINKVLNSKTLKEYTMETLFDKITTINHELLMYGYPKEAIIKMGTNLPALYSNSPSHFQEIQQTLKKFNWSREFIITKTPGNPALYTYSPPKMCQRITDIEKLGFTKEESLQIASNYPMAFGGSLETLTKKINYLKQIGLRNIIINHSERLRQSVEVTYARHCYITLEEKKKISEENYGLLFLNENYFKKRFGVNKDYLRMKYNYEEYERKLDENARTI